MKRGPLIALAVGFALGVGLDQLLWTASPPPPPPPTVGSPEPPVKQPGPETSPADRFERAEEARPPGTVKLAEEADDADPRPEGETRRGRRARQPERSFTNEELIEGLRTLLAGGTLGLASSPLWEGQRLSSVLWGRHGSRRPSRVPAGLVSALLSAGDPDLRVVGAGLAALSDPPMPHRIRELALEDPDIRVRRPVVGTIDRIARKHPELVEVLIAATRDEAPSVRSQALNSLANLCDWRPELGDRIVAGTRDPDADVREYSLHLLPLAGPAGIARATELLLSGSFDLESLDRLLDAAMEGDGLPEILTRNPDPEFVTTLILNLNSEEDEARVIAAFAGRFREMLALYQPEGDSGYRDFFRLAAKAGERDLLREVITSDEYERAVRLLAIEVSVDRLESPDLACAAARTALRDPKSPARFRKRVIETLLWSLSEQQKKLPHVRDLLEEAMRDDRSAWVREAARQFLE